MSSLSSACVGTLVLAVVTFQTFANPDPKFSILAAGPNRVQSEDPAVTKLREYVRINTSHPSPDYESAITWLRRQASYFGGLKFNLVRFNEPDLFALWFTWRGSNPQLKSVLLNSHMDVVSVNRDKWFYDPFEAYKDAAGNIYGRGTADMKSATIAELEALHQLKSEGFIPLRNIHLSVIPDEEIGGRHGTEPFVNSAQFKALNVGVDLDESSDSYTLNNGRLYIPIPRAQKSPWQINITVEGVSGHGSSVIAEGTAGQKLQIVIDRIMAKRASEIAKLDNPLVKPGDITSINLVRIGGGIGNNILPTTLWVVFDIRIRAYPENCWNFTDVEQFLNNVCAEAGPGVSYTFLQKGVFTRDSIADDRNIWWKTFNNICTLNKWVCDPIVLTPSSDAGYVRNAGISAFGFNPQIRKYAGNLPYLHQDNEAINERDFLDSISRYKEVIKSLASVSQELSP